ncbi:MFS transporter [Ornithinimicrobium humiphilum]|uniref:Putative MFS family arabinose efflux permease n=1 Tax=Ornithinimicrobium humiphilum TaxID=125288 RepID=A0A543KQ00_9MICO|nr:MFS transporter [Ornithinimicrobium humiphilum]TQM97150.1 putative MFS family arabinose efflux permease [Ornithinimicrobium humiphilum]
MSVATSKPAAPPVPPSIFSPGLRSASIGATALIALLALEYIAVGAAMPTVAGALDGYGLYNMAFGATVAASVVGMIVGGWWSDKAGPRPVTVTGVLTFAGGLLLAGLAPLMEVFVLGRAVQGLGSGMTTVAVYVVIAQRVPDVRRPAVFSLLAAAWVVPGLAGPLLTGVIVEHLTWRWVFLGVAPVALVALGVFWRALSATRASSDDTRARPATLFWAVVAAVGVGLLNMSGERIEGIELVVGPVILVLVAVASWRLLPPGTLRFGRGLPSVIGVRGAMGGSFLAAEAYLPLMLRDEHAYSPAQAGAVLAASSVAWALGSWVQGRLRESIDRYQVMTLGVVIFIAMMGLLAVSVWLRWPGWVPILVYAVATLGVGLAYPTTTLLTMRLSPAAEMGRNSSALQVGESLTGAVSLAVTGVVFGYFYAAQPHAAFVGALGVSAAVGMLALVSVLRSRPVPDATG